MSSEACQLSVDLEDQDLLSGVPEWLVDSHDIDPKLMKKRLHGDKLCKGCGNSYPPEAFRGGGHNCNKCRSRSGVKGKKLKKGIGMVQKKNQETADSEYRHFGKCSICHKPALCRLCLVTGKLKCREHGGTKVQTEKRES